jgi:hypothetical protein
MLGGISDMAIIANRWITRLLSAHERLLSALEKSILEMQHGRLDVAPNLVKRPRMAIPPI